MSYLDESGLSTYDSNLKEWVSSQESKTITSSIYPWTKTAKASTISCYPVGGTELKPVVDFLFTETPPASGDKSPTNPSTITGASSVNVLSFEQDLYNSMDLSYEMWNEYQLLPDGCIQFDAENNGSSVLYRGYYTNPISGSYGNDDLTLVLDLKSFSASGNSSFARINLASGDDSRFQFYANINIGDSNNETYKTAPGIYTLPLKLVANSTKQYFFRTIATIEPGYSIHTKYRLIVAKTSSLRSYVIPLGDTYYGGTIDLATGVMTVTHFLEQLSSSTNIVATGFSEGQSAYRVGMYLSSSKERMPYPITSLEGYACNSFPVVADPSVNSAPCFGLAGGSVLTYLCLTKAMLGVGDGATYDAVRAAVLSFLGSHQVKVAGKLATPYTVQLTPTEIFSLSQADKYTPRLNTIYTDASAVQVGYVKSPIREEFELQQAIVAQGGNI